VYKRQVLSRPLLTFAVEDATWGLALGEALETNIPDAQKRKLKSLNEAYVAETPQEEVVKQVNVLLAEVSDEKLRKELKKLANRAWERDRRMGRMNQGTKKIALQDTAPPPSASSSVSNPPKPSIDASVKGVPNNSGAQNNPPVKIDSTNKTQGTGSVEKSKIDSLIGAGRYIQALRSIENLDVAKDGDFVREKRSKAGERFCDEKRRVASETFKRARAATADTIKIQQLNRTAAELDSCLFYFPETSVGAKVKRNRELVDIELKKLGR
jgi:hypothetical protein